MNIAVYVTSNYSNYDEFSKLLPKYLSKYTTSPVLLTAISRSTKDGHGNNLVKRYADEHKLKYKIYETEWNKWKKSAGSIASYHISHNSEHSIVFWDGLSKGCKNVLQMAVRLNRPCDLVRINPSASNIPKDAENNKPTANATNTSPTPQQPQTQQNTQSANAPTANGQTAPSPQPTAVAAQNSGSEPTSQSQSGSQQPPDNAANTDGSETPQTPQASQQPQSGNAVVANEPMDAVSREFVKNTTTISQSQNGQQAQQQAQNTAAQTSTDANQTASSAQSDTNDSEENKSEQ